MQIHAELLSHEGATLDLRLSSPGVLAACVDEAVSGNSFSQNLGWNLNT